MQLKLFRNTSAFIRTVRRNALRIMMLTAVGAVASVAAAQEKADTAGWHKFRFGGYGEMVASFKDYGINRFQKSGSTREHRATIAVPRATLGVDYKFTPKWIFGMEIEFEALGTGTAYEIENTENGVVSMAGREGFIWRSRNGAFEFKPYLLVQAAADFNYYDSEGLDPAYNQDNVHNTGFSIPYAVLGFTGKAFGMITYNLSINAAASGGALLQQAWADIKVKDAFAVKLGKFKTPFTHATLTTLGETLFPSLPLSLTAPVILPHSLNAVSPSISTGFDLGVEFHGLVKGKLGYEAGLFNGTGASVNLAGKTFSDDWHIPSLLYAARFTFMPKGVMPATQGSSRQLNVDKMLFGLSASMNVESENESTNDFRAGAEFAWMKDRLYIGAEAYYMHVGFTKRQKIDESYDYLGGYVQGGYFITPKLQAALRYDFMDRNGLDRKGMLNMPSVGVNYFFLGANLKLQAMYRFVGRTGHASQLDRDNDDLGIPMHSATVQLQYTF